MTRKSCMLVKRGLIEVAIEMSIVQNRRAKVASSPTFYGAAVQRSTTSKTVKKVVKLTGIILSSRLRI